MFLFSPWELEGHFSLQADGDAGGTVQHWQDHLHPLSPRTGISFEKLPSNETFVTSLYSGLPWHQNRTRTNYRQVEPLESLSLSPHHVLATLLIMLICFVTSIQ